MQNLLILHGKSSFETELAQSLKTINTIKLPEEDAPLSILVHSSEQRGVQNDAFNVDLYMNSLTTHRYGLAGDLKKAMKDGKPIIIEGIHLDPSIYLMDDGNREPTITTAKNEELTIPVASDDNVETEKECGLESTLRDDLQLTNCIPESRSPIVTSSDQLSGASDSRESMDEAGDVPHGQGDALNIPTENPSLPVNKESSSGEPIIVPIVLKMAEFDRKDQSKLTGNLKTIQDYLCSFESQGLTVVNISATTFPQTLDWLHSYLLQCIERGTSFAFTEFGKNLDPI